MQNPENKMATKTPAECKDMSDVRVEAADSNVKNSDLRSVCMGQSIIQQALRELPPHHSAAADDQNTHESPFTANTARRYASVRP